jgi:hypothetical protein
MWYRKNVGGWERAATLIGGGLMLICGVGALHASPLGLLLSGAGVVTLVTGVFGYWPDADLVQRLPSCQLLGVERTRCAHRELFRV